MAIKCKVKPNQYTVDPKVSITQDKVKSEAHSAVKMLLKKGPDAKTSFFVKAQHFKGDKVKYKGLFLAIGDSPALTQKFKKEKTDPCVAYGNLFIKKIKDENVVHFEYVTGQGKLKKPGDWKAIFKEFKKMIKHKCALILDGQTIEDDTPDEEAPKNTTKETTAPKQDAPDTSQKEELTERLERKAKIAEELLLDVEKIKSAYDRELKEKLYRKTTKWLTNYNKVPDNLKTPALKSHFAKIQKAHGTVKDRLAIDDKITAGLDQVFKALDKYMDMPSFSSTPAQKMAEKIKAALNKVKPLIEKVKDSDLLKECEAIQKEIAQ